MKLGLDGRRALVTGGSKGLGAAIARELVNEGARVAICARSEVEVLAAAEDLRSDGGIVYAQRADVTDPEQVRDFVARSAEELGRSFGAGLTQREIEYLVAEEWAETAEDVLWRRTKCGLHMTAPEALAVADFMKQRTAAR